MKGFGWFKDTRSRRRVLLIVYAALAAVMALAALGAVIATTQISDLSFSDRLAEIGDWVGGGTLLLAALAAVVAVQAYAASTGLPDLRFQITFPSCGPNEVVFEAKQEDDTQPIWVGSGSDKTLGRITVNNESLYSAQNPAVVMRLNRMTIVRSYYSPIEPWIVIEESADITALQWDGGSDRSIHGRSPRQLPAVNFQGLTYRPGSGRPSITFELLAERYRREVPVAVDFTIDGKSQFGRSGQAPAWL